MNNLYIATVFAAALVFLLAALLLFARRKDGERSRIILAYIVSFSVISYSIRFIDLSAGTIPYMIISADMLLVAIFMVTSYILYPIEVISPGYLNFKRIVGLYTPWMLLVFIYLVSRQFGVDYFTYGTLPDMLKDAGQFQVWFRLALVLFIFLPVLVPFFIPYTRRYNNAGKTWMRNYSLLLATNCIAYILVLGIDHIVVKTIYYFVSAGCSLGIVYMELFVRLIGTPSLDKEVPTQEKEENEPERNMQPKKSSPLSERLSAYIVSTQAYRNPDLSIVLLSAALFTNRTSLALAIHELGYESFNSYINALRIHDFIELVNNRKSENLQDAFYTAGFRSRATAIRNFRQVTGMTPSRYFRENID